MHKEELVLYNPQALICLKQPKHPLEKLLKNVNMNGHRTLFPKLQA